MQEQSSSHKKISQSSFEDQYARIQEISGCRSQRELAECLEVRQSQISDAKRRKAVPADWLITLQKRHGINPDWIRTGIGKRILFATEAPERSHVVDYTTDELLAEIVRRVMKSLG